MAKRPAPSDPYALQRAKAAAAEKARKEEISFVAAKVAEAGAARDPGTWGLSAEIVSLPTAKDVAVRRGARGRGVEARRQDVFRELWRSGALDEGKSKEGIQRGHERYHAIERYSEDRARAMGVCTRDAPERRTVDHGGASDLVTVSMIDAGRRVAAVEAAIGRRSVAIIRALVDPMMAGEVRVWRVLVERVTGEKERHVQAGAVRFALENLCEKYEGFDAAEAALRKERRVANETVDSGRTAAHLAA